MILSVYVILKEIRKNNVHLNKQFFLIIVYKLVNEIIFIITYYVLIKLPKFGFFKNFFEENNWVARLFHVLAVQQTIFMFLITLLVSVNRYVAVIYPTKYNYYFSKSNMTKVLVFFIMLSTLIGLGTIPFKPIYGSFDFAGAFIPYFTLKEVIYYQIFYTVFLFGTLSIATCFFNIKAILELKKHKNIVNYYKREIIYIMYSIFIFTTLSLVEAICVIKVVAMQYNINILFYITVHYYIWAFDLPSLGDFYFLIYSR
uniref:Serpentine receptor class gamma n=1 Tax=Strongyloides papillosus TaxID=174720 RepID=A0A0N5B932_STREA